MQVTVDQTGEDKLAGRVDDAVGGRQPFLGRERDDPAGINGDAGVDNISRGDHAAALDDEVDGAFHRCGSFAVTGASNGP